MNGCKSLEFRPYLWPLWIGRVLVRAQEGQCPGRNLRAFAFRARPAARAQGDNSKRDAGISGVARRLFGALFGEYVGCRSVCHFRASCATALAPNGGVRSEDTRFLPINVHHSFSGSRGRMDRAEVSRHGLQKLPKPWRLSKRGEVRIFLCPLPPTEAPARSRSGRAGRR